MLPTAARHTMAALTPSAHHLSPAVGLALSAGGAHLVTRLYDLHQSMPIADGAHGMTFDGKAVRIKSSAASELARGLFHRNHLDEPLQPTTNRSLPGAHLSASLSAAIVGLAWRRPGSDVAVNRALREAVCSETQLGVPALARETGVTIARFEKLVEQVTRADDDPDAPLPHMGTSLMLRHLWLRATSSRELWQYLRALHEAHGVLDLESLDGLPDGSSAASLSECPPSEFLPHQIGETAAIRAARLLMLNAGGSASDTDATARASAFETLAAALALGGSRPAQLNQGRYSYRGGVDVGDCAEMVARELLNHLLWDPGTQRFDASRLPASARPELAAFYAHTGPAHSEPPRPTLAADPPATETVRREAFGPLPPPVYTKSAEAWFQMVSNLPDVAYLSGPAGAKYELKPSAFCHCLGVLLGSPDVRTPSDLETFWTTVVQPGRPMRLVTSALGDRMYLMEAEDAEGAEACTLEFVIADALNHAFAIHHWRPPSWHRDVAELAVANWPAARSSVPTDGTIVAHVGAGASPIEPQARAGDAHVTRLALMPALIQPLLAQRAASPDCSSGARDGEDERRRRLMLMSTDPSKDDAVGHALLALLDGADASSQQLAGRVLATTRSGLAGADDALLLRLALVAAESGDGALKHAAMLHPPLSAPAAVLCGADGGALSSWARGVLASPWRGVRLSAEAAWRRLLPGQRALPRPRPGHSSSARSGIVSS